MMSILYLSIQKIMLINYCILRIDDNKIWVNSIKEEIESIISEKWFTPEITHITEFPNKDENYLNYDLLLIDYQLANWEKWDELIKNIRQNKIYTDIIFYSTDIKKLHSALYSDENGIIEWIFTAQRESIKSKFGDFFEFNLKKWWTINSLRWIILAESSEIEDLMRSILEFYEKKDSESKDIIFKEIKHSRDTYIEQWEWMLKKEYLIKKNNKIIISSQKRLDILKALWFFEWNSYYDIYYEISSIRNKLAHAKNLDRNTLNMWTSWTLWLDKWIELMKKIKDCKHFFKQKLEHLTQSN